MFQRLANLLGRILPHKAMEFLASLSSSRRILFFICAFTVGWIFINWIIPHPLDDPRTGYPLLVLAFTIYFGIVEGVMKVKQAEDAAVQLSRDLLIAEQTTTILGLIKEVRDLTTKSSENDANMLLFATTFEALAQRILDKLGVKK